MPRPTNSSIFLRNVREAGGKIGNGALMKRLGWQGEKYWSCHQELVDTGLIAKGRGQGGTVILLVPDSPEDVAQSVASLPRRETAAVTEELIQTINEVALERNQNQPELREVELYKPALDQLRRNWSQQKQLLHGVYEVTAAQGRRDTGGSWSRPDLVAVGLRKFEYIPDRVLEVYSFEIKAEYDVSIKGVLEALAHREAATRSYVLYHTGGKSWDDFPEAQRIEQLAARHGVGVIIASKIDDFNDCWDERITAPRSSSDPETLDRFIKTTLTDDAKSQIRKWF